MTAQVGRAAGKGRGRSSLPACDMGLDPRTLGSWPGQRADA